MHFPSKAQQGRVENFDLFTLSCIPECSMDFTQQYIVLEVIKLVENR